MTNIFEQFSGADIERLADCLKAIKKAGLSIGKYTQAGVNENSGNVWVWDEFWPGCVVCSIGFDVFWLHSCPECGEEHEFDTYDELAEYNSAYLGGCECCTDKHTD